MVSFERPVEDSGSGGSMPQVVICCFVVDLLIHSHRMRMPRFRARDRRTTIFCFFNGLMMAR